MRTLALLLVLAVAFGAGHALAKPERDVGWIVKTLRTRHDKLMSDVRKIDRAGKDFVEIQEMRATGEYVLNEHELKMEKSGRKDFHIFMERYRNDTLETLALLEKLLGKEAYVDPLRKVFGDRLDTQLEVAWEDVTLDEVAEELADRFKAKVDVDGHSDMNLMISFEGKMTLLAVILQVETLFECETRVEGDKLFFVVDE